MLQWKDIVQRMSYASGFAGEVRDVTASSPEKTDEPFRVSYSYTRNDYPQWSERRISSPLPRMTGIIPDEEPNHPILLSLGEMRYQSRVEFPKGYSPRLPPRIDLTEEFGEYHALYDIEEGILHTERRLLVRARQLPANQYSGIKKFLKAISDDHDVYVDLQQRHITPDSYQDAIWTLPNSSNPDAAKAYDDARELYKSGETTAEIESLKRAVQLDPKFTRAWLWLGEIYAYRGRQDSALDALRSAISNDPQQLLSYKGLGFALMRQRKYDDAISVWQRLIAIAPDDPDGPPNLGATFFANKRYSDAISAFESATKLSPDLASLYRQLGTAYVRAGNEDKALAIYKKALEMDSTPEMYNDVGYELADANKQLPLALQYAERAVREEEEASTKLKLSELRDFQHSYSLAAYWDTLGWVYFRMGAYDKAEGYISSAWQARQTGVVGDHLGQLYEKENKLPMALRMYNLALETNPRLEDTQVRVRNLAHVSLPKNQMSAGEELSLMRTIKLPAITKERVSAYFDVLIVAGKIDKARFVSGSEPLNGAGDNLEKSTFEEAFPPNSTAHLFKRGVLTCSEIGCSFVFYPLSRTSRTN